MVLKGMRKSRQQTKWERLSAAIVKDDGQAVEEMLNSGLDPDHEIKGRIAVLTPLQIAIYHDALASATVLLRHGANPNKRMPLILACGHGREAICDLLLASGADVNVKTWGDLHERGETALMQAARLGLPTLVRKLLTVGADPSACTADGRNAVSEACAGGHFDLAKELSAAGCPALGSALIGPIRRREDEIDRAKYRNSAPDTKTLAKYLELIRLLINRGASVDVKFNLDGTMARKGGDTPLGIAVRSGDIELVRVLLSAGADVDELTLHNPPIVMAASNNRPEILKLLIEAGAEIDSQSHIGWTALTTAVDFPHLEVIKLLLAAGADPHRKARDGENAFTKARKKGLSDVLEMLQKSEAGGKDPKPRGKTLKGGR